MTYDTFESLRVGNRLKPTGKVRSYPVVKIGKNPGLKTQRVVYVLLNPVAVEKGKDTKKFFGICAAPSLEYSSHYINWDKVS